MKSKAPKLRFPEFSGDWEEKGLGELSTKIGDGIHSTPSYSKNQEFYFINGNNLSDKKIVINKTTKTVDENEYRKYFIELNSQTILISINGTIGNLGYYNGEKVILGKSSAYINLKTYIPKEYIYNYLQIRKLKTYFSGELTGSTIKNLSLATLRNTPIWIPSLPEQEKIASFLSEVDIKIEKLEKKKELLSQYKKGMMQKLFSQKLRFKDENGNDYPDWEVKTINKIAKISMGFTPNTKDLEMWNGEYKWLSIADMKKNTKYINFASKFITDKGIKNKLILPKGTLIMSFKLTLGRVGILAENMYTNEAICNFKWTTKNILTEYIYYYLSSINISSFGSRAAMGITLNTESLNSIVIKLSCLKEQEKIADLLSSIDRKIELVDTELERTKEFKNGLLQKMFV